MAKYLTLQDGRVVEAILPEGGGGGTSAPEVAIQPTEPTDEAVVLWYDTDAPGNNVPSYSPPTRQTTTLTTSTLANNASENLLPTFGSMWRLYRITVDRAARIRIYSTAAKQANDLSRPISQRPEGDHGVLFEYVSVGSEGHSLVPVVDGWNETVGQTTAFVTITNLSGSSSPVQATFTHIRTE